MNPDQQPDTLHRLRRPLNEINGPVDPNRRVETHSGRVSHQPDGSKISNDHGCRTGPVSNPVNPGLPSVSNPKPAEIARQVGALRSGNVPVRPTDGQLVRDVSF